MIPLKNSLLVFLVIFVSCRHRPPVCDACAPAQAYPGETGIPKVVQIGKNKFHYLEIKGEAVWEGDIILTHAQLNADTSKALFGAATLGRRWPDGIVYYKIDSGLPNQSRVTDAMQNWEAHSNVRFKLANENTVNYVLFTTGGGCSSNIGMIGGEQITHLANGCSVGNVVHEIGHDLGLFHEISRTDRDNTITILWDNIIPRFKVNFQTYIQNGDSGFDDGQFDFASVMMYDQYSFSRNGRPTITKKDGSGYQMQYGTLSPGDIQIIAKMYPSVTASLSKKK